MSAESQPQIVYLKDYTPPTHLIDTTRLSVDIGEEDMTITSRLAIRRNPDSADKTARLTLDGSNHLTLLEVKMDGRVLSPEEYTLTETSLTLRDAPDAFTLEIRNTIRPQDNKELSGIYQSEDKFVSQCEAEGFRNITYFLDRPDVLSVFTVEITADPVKYPVLLSNPDQAEAPTTLPDGRLRVFWHDSQPKPSYLFAFVAGDLGMIHDTYTTLSGREIELRIYTDKGDEQKATFAMEMLKIAMRQDEERTGYEYPHDLLMSAVTRYFNAGAMENFGLMIFKNSACLVDGETATDMDYFYVARVFPHEYFHHFTGDYVPPRDWFQLTLKEGLTVYRDQEFSALLYGHDFLRILDTVNLRARQFTEDAGPLAHPIRPDHYVTIENFYTRTVYDKGAEVIRMMFTLAGEHSYSPTMKLYKQRQALKPTTTEDFVKAVEQANGINLEQFERSWYSQAGTPEVFVTDEYDPATQTYTLHVRQHTRPTLGQPEKEPYHIPFRFGMVGADGEDIPLALDSEIDPHRQQASNQPRLTGGNLLHITESEQTFVFRNVPEKPVTSLLRGFSAPVKVHYDL